MLNWEYEKNVYVAHHIDRVGMPRRRRFLLDDTGGLASCMDAGL